MTGMMLLQCFALLDKSVIEKHAQPHRRKSHTRWFLPIAACLAVLLCCGVFFGLWSTASGTVNTLSDPLQIIDPVRIGQPDVLSTLTNGISAPPEFTFHCSAPVITARVLASYPDSYSIPDFRLDATPFPYRLLQLEVIDVIAGTGLPDRLWYLIPESLFVDMTGYDTLLISLSQVGFDSVVLENITTRRFEVFDLVFSSGTHPELGDIIAFTAGIFDERLWQEERWHYGYQFGKFYLDHPEHAYGNMVVFRDYTLEETVDQIRKKIREDYPQYTAPTITRLEFQSEAARQALEFVRNPENGLFVQIKSGNRVLFFRYAAGIRTNEVITIDLETEAVTRSSAVFTPEELTAMPDIPGYLHQLQTAEDTPAPPLVDPKGKELRSYGAYGEYIKVNSSIYGVVTELWAYREKVDANGYVGYYDVRFTLLDLQTREPQHISAEDLNALLGEQHFDASGCGTAFPIPMC